MRAARRRPAGFYFNNIISTEQIHLPGMLSKLLREPLVHFVLIGGLIYLLISALSPSVSSYSDTTIPVTDDALVTYLQKRDQVFDAALYKSRLASLSAEERKRLVEQYAEQEVLFREAKNLGLDQNDEVLRRRLIQKLKYFLEGMASTDTAVGEAEIKQYFADNQQDYRVAANMSFTHLFFKQNEADRAEAKQRALEKLDDLSAESQAGGVLIADHFPYHRNYAGKTAAQISRHFGSDFAARLFELQADNTRWQGPVESAYGHHLVLVSNRKEAYMPALEAVYQAVKQDAERAKFAEARQAQIDQLVAQYEIVEE